MAFGRAKIMCPACQVIEDTEDGYEDGQRCDNCQEANMQIVLILTVNDISEMIATQNPRQVVETLVHWANG
jgi:hypothetical protein